MKGGIVMIQAAKRSWLPILLLALAACSSTDKTPEVNPNLVPTDYKNEILNTLRKALDDPTNVREAAITDPFLQPVGPNEQRYAVCVRANARDQFRQYTGLKERIGYFYGGHLTQLVEAKEGECANAAYKPFPELEHLCLAKKCE
jgi:hypothetical protein